MGAPSPKTELFSDSGSGNPWRYVSGSGSGSGPGFRSGETSEEFCVRASRELAKEHGRFNARSDPSKREEYILHESAKAERARLSAHALRLLRESGGEPGYLVPDPHGIGARGYVYGGINQPYARELAAELSRQGVAGKMGVTPKLDANAQNFLAQALPYIRQEVFGSVPTSVKSTAMIVGPTIEALRVME